MKRKSIFNLLTCLVLLFMAACAQSAPLSTAAAPTVVQAAEEQPTEAGGQPTEVQSEATVQPTAVDTKNKRAVTSEEFGLSFTYDAALAQDAVISAVQAEPLTPQILYASSHPAYIGVAFPGYALQRNYQLPFPQTEPWVMIFRTSDFASYSTDGVSDFPSQKQALEKLLAEGVSGTHWSRGGGIVQELMPYLPWTNAVQAFYAQAKVLDFPNGKGVRYLTTFSQGPSPIVEPLVFYTFQGLSSDGQYYISAVFPVDTGVFPEQVEPGAVPAIEVLPVLLADQVGQVDALPGSAITPSLDLLDELVQSIEIK